jgi:hypothetical protein
LLHLKNSTIAYTKSSNLRDQGKIRVIALFSGDYPRSIIRYFLILPGSLDELHQFCFWVLLAPQLAFDDTIQPNIELILTAGNANRRRNRGTAQIIGHINSGGIGMIKPQSTQRTQSQRTER